MEQQKVLENKNYDVSGTILTEDNELLCDYDLFYCANFIPHLNNETILIVGVYGFAEFNDISKFMFDYIVESDTVIVKDYRLHVCVPELYEKYYRNIKYDTPRNDEILLIPWKRFPRTKEGVAIPQLIERIFGKLPQIILFV